MLGLAKEGLASLVTSIDESRQKRLRSSELTIVIRMLLFIRNAVITAMIVSALPAAASATAAPYTGLYVFGDSLSDRGNLAEAVGSAFPDPPSYHYSFTNGPTAISIVAHDLGLAADPSLWLNGFADTNGLFHPGYQPGTSYAVGGATAQSNPINGIPGINLGSQVAAYLSHSGSADPNALYTMFIGGNDVRGATLPGGGGTTDIHSAVAQELAALQLLTNAGATKFLIVNVPDIGIIPEFAQEHPDLASEATANTDLYNNLLSAGVDSFKAANTVELTYFDLYALNEDILAHAASYGITNLTDPCYTNAPFSAATSAACGPNAQNIGSFAYWNDVHPTRQIHALWADAIANALDSAAAAPEPSVWLMMLFGMGSIGALLRRQSLADARGVAA